MNFTQKFTKRDLVFAVLTGGITGVIGWRVFEFLKTPEVYGLPWVALVMMVPILWIFGVLLGYLLGQWLDFFNQFGKFAAIGFTNFAVGAGVLNSILALTSSSGVSSYSSGVGYTIANSIAFIVALLSSYIWNKYWAFDATQSGGGGVEFGKFLVVTIIAFLINNAVASSVVNLIHPVLGLNDQQWANIGTVAGSAVALIFSFIGFKLAVFKA